MTARRISYLAALAEGLREELLRDERVFVMGEDVEIGLFGITKGLVDLFGTARIRNTPISEAGFVGAAVGAAMTGLRPVVEFMIASFVYVAMDQLISQAAKSRFMFGGQCTLPIVFRAPMFYGGSNGAQHSDRPYPMFMSVPGLKVIAPATPADAKGLLKAAIRDDDPVMFFEDSTLWTMKGDVPEDEGFVLPIGAADVKRRGTDVTLIGIAGSLRHAIAAAEELEEEGISAEVVDPRTLAPLDSRTILGSVARTGRVVIADPAHRTCSAASEIAATIVEEGFSDLKAPVVRVTTPATHIHFSPSVEKAMYPDKTKIANAARRILGVAVVAS